MSETFIKIMVFYFAMIILSIVFVAIGLIVYATKDGQRDYVNEKFGIKRFFSNVRDSGKDNLIWLYLFVPILNVLMSFTAILALCTDIGDEL